MTYKEIERKVKILLKGMMDKGGHIDVPLVCEAIRELELKEFNSLSEQGDWKCPNGDSYFIRTQYDNAEPYTDIIRIVEIRDGKLILDTGESLSPLDIDTLPLELGNFLNIVRTEWTLTPKG